MNKVTYSKNLIYFVLLILLSISCKNQVTTKLQINEVIIGKEFTLDGTINPWTLQIQDSLIIIRDFGDSYCYHIHNKNTLKLIGKFGLNGRGPGEFIAPNFMYQKSGNLLYIYDNTRNIISVVNVLEAEDRLNYSPIHIDLNKKIIEEAFPLRSAVITSDSFIVGTSQNHFNLGRFFCYEISTGKIVWSPYFPNVSKTPHYMLQNELYSNRMALRPDGNDIAVASLYFKRIDILDKKGSFKRSIVFENQYPEPDFTSNNQLPPKGANQYFQSMTVTQKSIYVLDKNRTTDISESIEQFNHDTITLFISNWDAINQPTKSYRLTPRIYDISIDEENNKIYGLRANSSSIYIYDLKDIERYKR
jgi:hypothetical protein